MDQIAKLKAEAAALGVMFEEQPMVLRLEDWSAARWARTFERMRVALGARQMTIHVDLARLPANDESPADALVDLLGD